ncbi:hypothetical protein HGA64_05420 [Candidatus Falkowbacteria bacterium]|nr:hypothetical protein [Candidatus Falkowbacteria bacterium]
MDSETVAEQLRSTRQSYGYKLEKAAKDLGINLKYLDALERGDFLSLPSGVYGKNFLREYALYLRLDPNPLVKLFEQEMVGAKEKAQQELFSKQVVKASYFWTVPKIVKNLLILVMVVLCLWYLGYRLKKIVAPPELEIFTPKENLITKERSIEVKGRAEAESQVVINAEAVLLDRAGSFQKTVELKSGINTIIIKAQKKFGPTKSITRQILAE